MKMMLTSIGSLDQLEHAHAMKNTSSLTKKRMSARSFTVLRVVDKATAIRNQTDALMFVHTDYSLSTKAKLTSMVRIELSEPACAMKHTSSLTKKRMPARRSSVLRLVAGTTVMKKQIDALMDVPMD